MTPDSALLMYIFRAHLANYEVHGQCHAARVLLAPFYRHLSSSHFGFNVQFQHQQ